jgi:hypothetical protein
MRYHFLKSNLAQMSLLFLFAVLNLRCTEEDLLSTSLEITESPLYDFGPVIISSSMDHTFTITNSGVVAATNMSGLDLEAPFSFKGGVYPGTGGTCATSLEVGSTCSVVLTFTPTTNGTFNETLFIRYNNGVINRLLELDLVGAAGTPSGGFANLIISDGPFYDFGSVNTGNSTIKVFTVTNVGVDVATAMMGLGLAAPFSFQGGAYPGAGGTCAVTLAAAASCTVVVNFAPTFLSVFTDTLNLDYNDGIVVQTASRNIQGVGI